MEEVNIKQNVSLIRERIAKARGESGIAAREVTLIAVSKTVPAGVIRQALLAGHRDFGENRVQEAYEKWPALLEEFPDARLHLIGRLQTNKVKEAITVFHAIHSVDSERLAEAIAREAKKQGKNPEVFIQVNTGEEPQKGGVKPSEVAGLVAVCRNLGLNFKGLMCIPPADEEPSPHFALLRQLAVRSSQFADENIVSSRPRVLESSKLSMGMSGDFEKAVRMGATHVRVGTAIFGERQAAMETG